MKEIIEFKEEYYENLLNNIKTHASEIFEKISSNKEIDVQDNEEFINTSLDTIEILLKQSTMHNEDFLLELQSYLKRIQSLLGHYNKTENHEEKKGLLHKYKYRILKGLLDLEYEIGTI
ncbi:hypothetical protein [Clostridium sp.]|uniref:hypothetical protein n=1 Tax=Clostridium sp. TaxID=1506 RepID=UPI0039929989